MTFWLWGYFLVLPSVQKTAFQNFDFQGGSPYGPVLIIRWISDKTLFAFSVLKIDPFSVVHPNLCHSGTYVHEILALVLFFGPL